MPALWHSDKVTHFFSDKVIHRVQWALVFLFQVEGIRSWLILGMGEENFWLETGPQGIVPVFERGTEALDSGIPLDYEFGDDLAGRISVEGTLDG